MHTIPAIHLSTADEPKVLRHERDRFVAFAFCAADILVEIDADSQIVYVAGAVSALLGRGPDALMGTPIGRLAYGAYAPVLHALEHAVREGRRLEPILLRLDNRGKPTRPLLVTGYQLPEFKGRCFLAFRLAGSILTGAYPENRTEGGLLDGESFANMAAETTRRDVPGDRLLTLIEIANMRTLMAQMDGGAQKELNASIGACLRACSLNGDSAGEFGPGRYGVVHRRSMDAEVLTDHIRACTEEVGPDRLEVQVNSSTIDLDVPEISPDDATRALLYAIRQFGMPADAPLSLSDLSSSLIGSVRATGRLLALVRDAIADNAFEVVFQPVVELESRRCVHCEALVRVAHQDIDMGTQDFICFLEQTGLIADFDLAMCHRVLSILRKSHAQGLDYRVAVNVSGLSLDSPAFRRSLIDLLDAFADVRKHLLFEVTESMALSDLVGANRFIQTLRRAGHQVCLDDFGVGAAAFEYLRSLEIDYVKIDGSYLQEAIGSEKGKAFLKAMGGLCGDLGIVTVAEMVEAEDAVTLLRQCGISFGQGYLFGHPEGIPQRAKISLVNQQKREHVRLTERPRVSP